MTVDIEKLEALAEHHQTLGHAYTLASPATVLELIADFKSTAHDHELLRAENEALRKDVDRREWEGFNNGLTRAGNLRPSITHSDDGGRVLNDIRRQIDAAMHNERDDSGYIATMQRLERNRDMWKGQVERQAETIQGLRKDAERYQWLREPEAGNIEVVEWIGPHAASLVGDDLDSVIDAAMSKEASHD